MVNKDRCLFQYNSGDLVYIISPPTIPLRTSSKKASIRYLGPLVIFKIIGWCNYLLMTVDSIIWSELFQHGRLKTTIIRNNSSKCFNWPMLKQVLNMHIRVDA